MLLLNEHLTSWAGNKPRESNHACTVCTAELLYCAVFLSVLCTTNL